jgi:hypothetical protein
VNDLCMVQVTFLAWGVAVGTVLAAVSLTLLNRTRGFPARQRVMAMGHLVGVALKAALPPRWLVGSLAAGFSAFAGVFLLGAFVTLTVVRLIPMEVPHPTEAYEGFGDYMRKMIYFWMGISVSTIVAGWVGGGVGIWTGLRLRSRLIGTSSDASGQVPASDRQSPTPDWAGPIPHA